MNTYHFKLHKTQSQNNFCHLSLEFTPETFRFFDFYDLNQKKKIVDIRFANNNPEYIDVVISLKEVKGGEIVLYDQQGKAIVTMFQVPQCNQNIQEDQERMTSSNDLLEETKDDRIMKNN